MRSLPPDIPTYKPPAPPPVKEGPKFELADDEGEPVPREAPAPRPIHAPPPPPKTQVEAPPESAPPPPPVETPKEQAAATIVGTWRVTEMSHNGQTSHEMDQMQMTLTFQENGTMEMSMSGPQLPQAMQRSGTYTTDGDSITMTMENRPATGTFKLDGDTLALDIEETKMMLNRQ